MHMITVSIKLTQFFVFLSLPAQETPDGRSSGDGGGSKISAFHSET